ncbi:MAG: imidazole glycerol phosphate synthase subunit HisH [Oscillospiraceae bacterium]
MGYTAIIDYGAGNLMSVTNALNFLGYENRITSDVAEMEMADRLILPGVGAFPAAMEYLGLRGLLQHTKRLAVEKPFLGICLGMQMLFDSSDEFEETDGLGLIPGRVRKIDTGLKLPHIGWNSLDIKNPCAILKGFSGGEFVYFVHSFCAVTERAENLSATASYGEDVAAVVFRGNIFGCQFHPEKSGDIGLSILKNFCEI